MFETLFKPRGVAIIGASQNPEVKDRGLSD